MIKRLLASFVLLAWAGFVVPAVYAGSKTVSDDLIYDNVRRKLATDDVIKGGGLDLDVKDGKVVLKGSVDSEKKKEKAEKVARKVAGVKSVDNEIRVVQK